MRDTFSSIPLWAYTLLTVSLSPLATYMGFVWGWTPGAASLAALALPTCAAALSGNRTTAMVTALLAAVACFAEPLVAGPTIGDEFLFAFPLSAACVLLISAGVIAAITSQLCDRVGQLEEQNTQYVRTLYERDRQQEPAATAAQTGAGTHHEPTSADDPDDDTVNFAMMLLALQDIGRRVSSNLDLGTLLPTIVSSAKSSLRCGHCQVYLWNAREESLRNPLPEMPRDPSPYVPRPRIGMAGWVLEHRQILTRKTLEQDYDLAALRDEDPVFPDAIAPLSVGGELLGLLVVDRVEQDSPTFERLLYILANIYALGIKNAQLFKRIEEMARRDGLTGLLNHASFQLELQTLLDEAVSSGSPLSVVMSDVDHFKKFNDTYGHQAGDHVLREVARLWKALLPDHVPAARYGGEEFILAVPRGNLTRGRELAELLRISIETHVFDFEGQQLHVTASFGVTELHRPGQSTQDLIRLADEALYTAKEAGRNRIACDPGLAASVAETEGE